MAPKRGDTRPWPAGLRQARYRLLSRTTVCRASGGAQTTLHTPRLQWCVLCVHWAACAGRRSGPPKQLCFLHGGAKHTLSSGRMPETTRMPPSARVSTNLPTLAIVEQSKTAQKKKDGPGEALHAIPELDVCLPITPDPVHTAAQHTYAQKRGTRLCRPDFLGVPFPTTMLPG